MVSAFYGQEQNGKGELKEAFFGVGPSDKESLLLEGIFTLMYYGGFTYKDAYNIPVWQKKWFIDRIIKELNRSQSPAQDGDTSPTFDASRALHHNSPQTRELQGMARNQVPSRLRRFT